MRRYGRVWTVFRKELIETLRDRRTLIAMVVVPIVLYPALMVILVEALKSESGREAEEHYVIAVPDEVHRRWLEGVLSREEAQREREDEGVAKAEETGSHRLEPGATDETGDADETGAAKEGDQGGGVAGNPLHARISPRQFTIRIAKPGQSLWDLVAEEKCHAAILMQPSPDPNNFADRQNRVVQIIYCDTRPLSEVIYNQLEDILADEARRIVRARVKAIAGSDELLKPLKTERLSTASPARQFAKILALVVPFLLVTMTVTGALYPAIDLTAGERERGTLETLAVSPVPVGQIVAGKFGVIVTIAMATTALNLASMTAVIHFSKLDRMFAVRSSGPAVGDVGEEGATTTRSGNAESEGPTQQDYRRRRVEIERESKSQVGFVTAAAPVVLLSMVPFAVLFGAVMLAVCSFARTFKEAQNYMMPVMMAAIVPAMVVSYMPTIKLEGTLAVIPVVNIVLLMRELFLGHYQPAMMGLCLISTCFYAAVAVTVATKVYGNEAVLFSDVGSYKTLLLRRFIQPRTYPGAAFALLTVAIIFPLNFYVQSSLISPQAGGGHNQVGLAVSQVLLFAAPPLLLGWYCKLDLRRTFSLYRPRAIHWVAAGFLAVSIVPLSNLLQQVQFSLSPPSEATREMLQQQAALFSGPGLWITLIVFALLPGVCEELLFRGLLLAGLRRRLSAFQVVVAVGVVFGLFHVEFEKIPIVSLMGVLLALVCLRSGSIFTAMLVHVANNGLAMASERIEPLREFLGLPLEGADLGMVQFDERTGLFLAMFVVGLVLLMVRRRGDINHSFAA